MLSIMSNQEVPANDMYDLDRQSTDEESDRLSCFTSCGCPASEHKVHRSSATGITIDGVSLLNVLEHELGSKTNHLCVDPPYAQEEGVNCQTGSAFFEVWPTDEDLFEEVSTERDPEEEQKVPLMDEGLVSMIMSLEREKEELASLTREFSKKQRQQFLWYQRSVESVLARHQSLFQSALVAAKRLGEHRISVVTFGDTGEARDAGSVEQVNDPNCGRMSTSGSTSPCGTVSPSVPCSPPDVLPGNSSALRLRRLSSRKHRERALFRADATHMLRSFISESPLRKDFEMLKPSASLVRATLNQLERVETTVNPTPMQGSSARRQRFYRLVTGRVFQRLVVAIVLSNAILVGIESHLNLTMSIQDYDAGLTVSSAQPERSWSVVADIAFVVCFFVEVVMRCVAFECQFFTGKEWLWNWVDLVVLIAAILEVFLLTIEVDLSFVRVFRLLRIPSYSFRIFRSVKLGTVVRTLRLILLALMKSLGPFVWALLILLLTICMFAMLCANAVAGHVQEVAAAGLVLNDDYKTYFGSMPQSLLTLFMAISGGVDWFPVWKLLNTIHAVHGGVFLLYVCLSQLAVLNIITGIFVNDALENASLDHELLMQKTVKQNKDMYKKLRFLFEKMAPEGGSCITLQDFEQQLNSYEVKLMFQFMGLETSDALRLFRILDVDDSGLLEIEEFVVGFMRLKSKTNMIDFECTLKDLNLTVQSTKEVVSEHLRNLQHSMSEIVNKLDG